ncbi:RHS repeat-associated core domain-containing protein [Burkholderia cepacia]|uniref:RHS repeat-associated core domain-containing protein n=1 Tax=Burkholderia cepacia TaxID=292 RepID=UPI003D36A5DC
MPVAQAVRDDAIELLDQPEYGDYYRQDEDPLWGPPPPAPPIDGLAWYQCDHLGTPQELTDEHSEIAWSAEYRAWGVAQEAIRKAAGKVSIANPIRFQGQYHDHETGLHYNRYRSYDPNSGRFVSKDPIGLQGGLNLHAYAPNPTEWVDPLGLWPGQPRSSNGRFGSGQNPNKPPLPAKGCDLHGNDLDSKIPAIGYTLRDRTTGEILKYGETTRGKARYTEKYLDSVNADMFPEAAGTKRQMHCWQHQKILDYKAAHGGQRPRLNLSDY